MGTTHVCETVFIYICWHTSGYPLTGSSTIVMTIVVTPKVSRVVYDVSFFLGTDS